MKTNTEKEIFDSARKDPRSWKGYFFYMNGNDSRIFVPKRIPSMGWTLNFANPYSYLILLSIIIIPILISILF